MTKFNKVTVRKFVDFSVLAKVAKVSAKCVCLVAKGVGKVFEVEKAEIKSNLPMATPGLFGRVVVRAF